MLVRILAWPAMAGLLTLAAPAAAQQSGVVAGRVVHAESGAPLPGVTVTVVGTGLGAVTGATGGFRIAGVAPGAQEVAAQRVGLTTLRQPVEVVAGAAAALELRMTEAAVLLPEVVVSATREARRLAETAASVGVVSSEELRAARPAHPGEVMQRIPGVWVGVTGGEGHTTAIRLPKTTDPVYLYLEDGVPTRSTGFFNHNALYEVNLPQAERVEVLKGPATALYGSDAIGGVINVETRSPGVGPNAEAYVEGGANGWGRLLLSGAERWGREGIRADLNLTRSEGWRSGTGYDRQSATLRWDHDFGGARLKTVLTGSRIDQQTAGSSALLRDDYVGDPSINYTPISLREVRALRFSSALEGQSGGTLFSLTPYLRWNEMELLPNWSLTYDPTIYTSGHSSAGVLARVRHDLDPLRTRLIAGVDVDVSPGGRTEHRIDPRREGRVFTDYQLGELIYDYDVTFHSVSPYVQAESSPVERLHLTAGLRYDRMGYRYRSALEPLQTGRWRRPADADVEYRHWSPKLGATLEIDPALNVFASYTHGFRAPSEGQLFRQGTAANTVGLAPVTAVSAEAGVRGEVLGRVGYTLGAYRMVVENDILTYVHPDGTRETQNAGETLHRGVEAGLGLALTAALRLDVSASWAEHTYRGWSPQTGVDYSGNEQESAPNVLASARLGWSPEALRGGRLGVEWSRVGAYWMDAENTHRYPGHDLLGLNATLPLVSGVEVNARLLNATDRRFAESAAYTQARGEEFAPGLPRTLYLGVQYRWER